MTDISVVITRHRCPVKGKCFYATVCVGEQTVNRSFFAKGTAYKWAEWAVANIDAAVAAQAKDQAALLGVAA